MASDLISERTVKSAKIYAYSDSRPELSGLLKIGYTTQDVEKRVKQQFVLTPGKPTYTIVLEESAVRNDGSTFTDYDVHKILRRQGFKNPEGEWFRCTAENVKVAINSLVSNKVIEQGRHLKFKMRPEQKRAVQETASYLRSVKKEKDGKVPHFLWNAKMRFGKTFATYQLMLEMKWKKVLVLTFKPEVESSWQEDIAHHVDFADLQFIHRDGLHYENADKTKPFVCFGSFQDYLGKNEAGGIKAKNEWVHTINWDCVVIDEYHYGAWRENAKELFEGEQNSEIKKQQGEGIEYFDEDLMPITTNAYLYLSGTPFRAIALGEFIEEQIFNWTYSDEQQAKERWEGEDNPYSAMPRMIIMTYQIPISIQTIAEEGEFDEFDLNEFFRAEGKYDSSTFVYEESVQKWLDFIRGANLAELGESLKQGESKPPLPFSDTKLLSHLNHTFWFLPNVASCYAMKNLLESRQNVFFHDYKVVIAAGSKGGSGFKALESVKKAMDNPLESKTITLSCAKLTTGVSVKPWSGIFMLKNLSRPETYFQAAFRVQSPWQIYNPDGKSPNQTEILKKNCYVFDFAPNRALRQIVDYSCRLQSSDSNIESNVDKFIKFLPVLAYDGGSMKQVNTAEILDIAMSGTSATLLARRWESPVLVNVDNNTLSRLMNDQKALDAVMKIEGFRKINADLETIINTAKSIKNLKERANEGNYDGKDRNQLSREVKEYNKLRKQIQVKLMKFATRIPVFMYLTDFREHSLKDVITQLEPGLFKKVTGLSISDFELLLNFGVFNSTLMNEAVYKFKRYEDSSLGYIGINKHEGEKVGLFDTVVSN